jgi:hypothetical protein
MSWMDHQAEVVLPQPFGATSFWNTKHNQTGVTDGMSGTWIAALKKEVGANDYIKLVGTDSDAYGTAIYVVSDRDSLPQTKITCNDPSGHCYGFKGSSYWLRVPRSARPSDDNDSEMVVLDQSRDANVAVWLYRACPPRWVNAFCTDQGSGDTFTAYGMSVHNLSSSGLDGCWPTHYPVFFPPPPLGPNDPNNRGHRGIPGAFIGVRYEEVVAGLVAHTLKVSLPNTKADTNYFPLSAAEQNLGDIPEGVLIRIKPSVNLHDPKYDLNGYALVIAEALQDYGAVVGDTSDNSANLKVENLFVEGSPYRWDNPDPAKDIGSDSLSGIPLEDFEFVKRGYGVPLGFVWNGFCEDPPP